MATTTAKKRTTKTAATATNAAEVIDINTGKEAEVFDFFSNTSEKNAKPKKSKSTMDVIDAPNDIQVKKAIDKMAEIAPAFKAMETALEQSKAIIAEWAKTVHASRMINGDTANFKIRNGDKVVKFMVKNVAKDCYGERLNDLEEAYPGIKDLFTEDPESVRFNQDFLKDADNKQKLLKALAPLGKDFLSQMFTSAKFKPIKEIKDKAVKLVETAEDLESLYDDISLSRYVQAN